MANRAQSLDEILAKHNGELGITWEDPDVVTPDTKQAILRWVADEFNIIELNDVYAESDTARGAVRQTKANYAQQFKQRLAQHGYKGDQR